MAMAYIIFLRSQLMGPLACKMGPSKQILGPVGIVFKKLSPAANDKPTTALRIVCLTITPQRIVSLIINLHIGKSQTSRYSVRSCFMDSRQQFVITRRKEAKAVNL